MDRDRGEEDQERERRERYRKENITNNREYN
jgi:hypothetical protein